MALHPKTSSCGRDVPGNGDERFFNFAFRVSWSARHFLPVHYFLADLKRSVFFFISAISFFCFLVLPLTSSLSGLGVCMASRFNCLANLYCELRARRSLRMSAALRNFALDSVSFSSATRISDASLLISPLCLFIELVISLSLGAAPRFDPPPVDFESTRALSPPLTRPPDDPFLPI